MFGAHARPRGWVWPLGAAHSRVPTKRGGGGNTVAGKTPNINRVWGGVRCAGGSGVEGACFWGAIENPEVLALVVHEKIRDNPTGGSQMKMWGQTAADAARTERLVGHK